MSKDDVIFEEDSVNMMTDDDGGLSLDDFSSGNFISNPAVGDNITFTVLKVRNNPNTKGKNAATGAEFDIGLRDKKGNVKRTDIDTDLGAYTVKPWEMFFKLFSSKEPQGVLVKYAKEHNKKFTGAKVSITRLEDGQYAQTKIEDLAKIRGTSIADAKVYQEKVQKAVKEKRLFEVTLVG
jgi:hypothetical protein